MVLAPSGRELLESDLQHRLIDRARARGCYVRKMQAISYNGFPDLIVVRHGTVMLWEVKTMKGRLSKMQDLEHRKLVAAGARVLVTFGLHDAFEQLDRFFPENL